MKKYLYIIIFIICLIAVYSSSSVWEGLTKGQADTLYCPLGSCSGSSSGGGSNISYLYDLLDVQNYSGTENNIFFWNGTKVTSLAKPSTNPLLTYRLQLKGGATHTQPYWYDITTTLLLGWDDVLDVDTSTGGNNPKVNNGDYLIFGTYVNLTNDGGALRINTKDGTGNVTIDKSVYADKFIGNNITVKNELLSDSYCGVPTGTVSFGRNAITSGVSWSLGNGELISGVGQGCAGTITTWTVNCDTTGTSLDVNLQVNGATISSMFAPTDSSTNITQVNYTFAKGDRIGVQGGTEVGTWAACGAMVYMRYK
jgi:hypothetical protein